MGSPADARMRERFWRPVMVPLDLKLLHGPVRGEVTLPRRLYWSGDMTFDLNDAYWRGRLLEIVLREALRVDDVEEYVDDAELRRQWGELRLPPYVREAWEAAHPDLAACRA